MKDKKTIIEDARKLLRSQELAILSTHSKKMSGYPFGSVTTYITTVHGEPIFYISDIAQHTKNIDEDPKMSLIVYTGSEQDANEGARLTIIGEAEKLTDETAEKAAERFYRLFPESKKYKNAHGFHFYLLKCHRARYIGGFGEIHWIKKDDWLVQEPEWLNSENDMIEHMNQDHEDAMQLILKNRLNIDAKSVNMLAINPDGFFVRADQHKPLFINFDELASDNGSIRKQLVKMTNQARETINA